MRVWPPTFSALLSALLLAGCELPMSVPSPLGSQWRPHLGVGATFEPRASVPAPETASEAPDHTAAWQGPVDVPLVVPVDAGMIDTTFAPIAFQSDRHPSEGGYDIYLFDADADTVIAIVGVNTRADETFPAVSDDGRWLAFQRGVEGPDGLQQDIYLYDRHSRLVSLLPGVNSADHDESEPAISGDGRRIAYVSNASGHPAIRLYDVVTGDAYDVPGANRRLVRVGRPALSGDGNRIAYEAASAAQPDSSDIYLYDIPTGTQLTPPFVNTPYREGSPALSGDGRRVLFVSNRLGSDDIFEVDLGTGMTDNLSFLNSDHDEGHPIYLGGGLERIAFDLTIQGEYPVTVIRAFDRRTQQIDTLPIANALLSNSALAR